LPKTSLGIGIIGAGFGASVQLPGFLGIPGVQVIGIVSRDSQRQDELRKLYKLERTFGTARELIECEDVDLVSIATPPAAQEELVRAAITAKKSVLCEKPFTLSAPQARSLLREAERSGIVHAIDFEFRELSALQLLRERLKSGSIGPVRSAELRWRVGTWADPLRPWSWQCDRSQGGGVLSALGVHLFDSAEWLLGPIRKLRATIGISISERPDIVTGKMKPVTGEDHVFIEMRGEGDIPVTITLSNVDAAGTGLEVDIHGGHGALLLRSGSQEYGRGLRVTETHHGEEPRSLPAANDVPESVDSRIPPFRSLASRLIATVRKGDGGFCPSFFEGMRAQMIREAALQSSSAGGWVEIAERVP